MVPLKSEWTRFADLHDKLEHFRLWGLISSTCTTLCPVMVVDGYWGIPEPCEVVGHQNDKVAVIELADGYHAVRGEHLAELQPQPYQTLHSDACFTEILSDYVVVDIETTGFSNTADRIIELAAARYEYGRLVDTFHTMVNPGMLLPTEIIKLTGITQEEVDRAPDIEDVTSDFLAFIGSLPIIGHNAVSFDVPFLVSQMKVDILNPVVDTLPMARAAYPRLPRYKLEYIKKVFDLSSGVSHRAMADVETTNALLWACLAPNKYEQKMWKAYMDAVLNGEKVKRVVRSKSPASRADANVKVKEITPTQSVDPTHPLFGKLMVFTGELSIPRKEAMQMAVDCGAILRTSVSAKTDYLVVGVQDADRVGENGMSDKERNASQLNRTKKANIEIVSEAEFMDLITRRTTPAQVEQMGFLSDKITETDVYEFLYTDLLDIVHNNSVDPSRLMLKEGKSYSSVWYDTQMAFRICCRSNHHYFGVSNNFPLCIPESLHDFITNDGKSDGFINYSFNPTLESVAVFKPLLSAALDAAIDALPKEYDCCSRFDECSNAKRCVHPNPTMAIGCGYRKILKSGRIFYGPNRNID